ncbi:hypothetical protein PIB30_106497, partial [Stylosanthes scabra]|nr:hypothetical protein [Stylosanthes scabra]
VAAAFAKTSATRIDTDFVLKQQQQEHVPSSKGLPKYSSEKEWIVVYASCYKMMRASSGSKALPMSPPPMESEVDYDDDEDEEDIEDDS